MIILKTAKWWSQRTPSQEMLIFSHLKLCLAIAIHNFKWLKISLTCKIKVEMYMIITDVRHI